MEYHYAVEYGDDSGRWVEVATFDGPLDPDRFYQFRIEARGIRALRVIRYAVSVTYEPPQSEEG